MAMRVVHGVDSERGVWESMESMNGEARKVIRHNDKVFSIYPERKQVTVSLNEQKSSLHPTLPHNLQRLSRFYSISRNGSERIAGRDTTVIEVDPIDKFRYGYRYWLDADTGVLLRCDMFDEEGSIIEQMMYTEVDYPDEVPPTAFETIDVEGYTSHKLDDHRTMLEKAGWRVADLPQGFMLTHSSASDEDSQNTLHFVYSDGLASVSVFIEPAAGSPHTNEGASSMGPLNAYSRTIDSSRVMVVGEVPVATVSRIAQTLEPVR
jgi:sigma-E factor negative regulatory protein RseB